MEERRPTRESMCQDPSCCLAIGRGRSGLSSRLEGQRHDHSQTSNDWTSDRTTSTSTRSTQRTRAKKDGLTNNHDVDDCCNCAMRLYKSRSHFYNEDSAPGLLSTTLTCRNEKVRKYFQLTIFSPTWHCSSFVLCTVSSSMELSFPGAGFLIGFAVALVLGILGALMVPGPDKACFTHSHLLPC